jgi:3-deoxy-D-manno-octulosonic-acid transferase
VPKFAKLARQVGSKSRLGDSPAAQQPQRFWVHAISVGEVEAARTFVPALAEAYPQAEIVISTTTLTGQERAARLFPERPIFYFPLDLAPCVLLALARVRPTAVIQVESEWWPNFFFLARLLGVPVLAVNVRLTERGARGYDRIRRCMRAVFNSTRAIGVQSELYRDRLLKLGADPALLRVTGQMKHDGVAFADTVPGTDELRREMQIEDGESVLVAGSTAPGEEETCGVVRRSRTVEWQGSKLLPPVLLGDTMGELMKWYAIADIVFIGRSLAPLGGSNPMEPGSLAKPLLWGPRMFNFPDEAPAFVAAGAAREVLNQYDLAAAVVELLTRPERRRQMGLAARETIRGMQGATARSIALVRETLADVYEVRTRS